MSVYFYGCMTLDGYLADKNHCLDWLHETGTTEDTGYELLFASVPFLRYIVRREVFFAAHYIFRNGTELV